MFILLSFLLGIVDVFFNEVNSDALFESWTDIASELGIKSYKIKEWRQEKLLNKLTLKDILREILECWKTEKGTEATLTNLLNHLEHIHFKNAADDLRKFFSTENRVNEGGQLFKSTLPSKSNYYISRTLITKRVIDVKIFSSTSCDVFVLHGDGIDRHQLSKLANRELTDTSGNQVRKQQLSVRFILLEHFGDWALLRGKTTKAIHLLRHHEGKFHWICTKGDISALQNASDEKTQIKLSEEEFIQEIETDLQFQTNQPICISDSPGMGKSLLLANIGRKLQQRYPQRIITFIVVSEFVVKVRALLPKFDNTKLAMLEALLQMLFENTTEREHFVTKLTAPRAQPSTQVELMFDGFDEVSTENFELANECLEILKTNFNSAIRVWVTTRPQHLHKLEKRFYVLGYNIQAFQEKHQIDFLTSYWNKDGMNLDGDKLHTFSKNCLSTLKKKLNKKDEDIAGIPLQCMMIADVYMQDAHRFCDPKNVEIDNHSNASSCIDVNTIADLYGKMILHKITKFVDTYPLLPEQINCILPCHMYLALQLIFPSHAHHFKDILQIGSSLEEDYLVNIGILERRGSTTEDTARFIHRTFAEYLAARFLVAHVIAPSIPNLQNASMGLPDFLFEHVLECSIKKESFIKTTYYQCSFKHSVVCHFLDALLGSQMHISTENYINEKFISHVNDTIYVCIHADFGNIIRLLCSLKYPNSVCINYIDSEILIDATTMASLDLLKFLLQTFGHEPLTAIKGRFLNLRTALHAAVRRGCYTIFEYILKEHDFEDLVKEDKDERFTDLLYHAVENTTDADFHEIQDRIQILTALFKLNMGMINYCDDYNKQTPLHAYGVNILLLKKLVECGANLLHVDYRKETILHRATEYLSATDYYDLLQFIPKNTLKLVLQMRTDRKESSLNLILIRGLATPDILNLILSMGVDINASNIWGVTCLFHAIGTENEEMAIQTVKLLLDNGADHTRVDSDGNSILHYLAERGRIDCLRFFLEEKNMDINQINKHGESPIFFALHNFKSAWETVEFLLERGADHKILNSNGEDLLHYSMK